jgi:hypothetical protein
LSVATVDAHRFGRKVGLFNPKGKMPTDADLQDIQAYLQTFVPPRKLRARLMPRTLQTTGGAKRQRDESRAYLT